MPTSNRRQKVNKDLPQKEDKPDSKFIIVNGKVQKNIKVKHPNG